MHSLHVCQKLGAKQGMLIRCYEIISAHHVGIKEFVKGSGNDYLQVIIPSHSWTTFSAGHNGVFYWQ